MNGTQIGVALAKSVCEIAVSQTPGRVQEHRRRSRAAIRGFFAARAPAQVVMEACSSAHHWGREFQRLGLTATALVAFVGNIQRFRSGRDFAACLGLPPREHSTGQARRLGSIPKRVTSHVRMLLVHGARSALRAGPVARQPDDLRTWARTIALRKGHNVAAVALATKLARVCWRVWRDGRPFERREAAGRR